MSETPDRGEGAVLTDLGPTVTPPVVPAPVASAVNQGVAPQRDASAPDLLPTESTLEMPEQDFKRRLEVPRVTHRRAYWVPRAAVFAGALLLTGAFAYELYAVLSFVRMTPIQVVFLVLSTIAFGWIALGSLSAVMGFLPLFADEKADTIDLPKVDAPLSHKIALLFPVYHENPARIAGTIAAMAGELAELNRSAQFSVFIVSDTRGEKDGVNEEAAYRELKQRLAGTISVFYRRRRDNTARKAGNIKDWVERFGGGYQSFIIPMPTA